MIVNKENELLAFKEIVLHVKQAQIKIFSYLEGTHNF
jgi:hypothetical protein